MNSSVRLILILLFFLYQFWAFKNKKSLMMKLSPIILSIVLAILMFLVLSISHFAYLFIFVILFLELSVRGAMLVVLLEALQAFLGKQRNLKRCVILVCVFLLLAAVYYLGEKVF